MKKAFEIMEQMKQNRAKIEALEGKVKSAKWEERKFSDFMEAAKEAELLKIENKVLHDNARQALFSEALPVILEELHKFSGKPYGEKTEKKISDAVKARINCAFYMRSEYSGTGLHLVPLNEKGFSGCSVFGYGDFDIYTKYENGERPRVLVDNKIQMVPAEKFFLTNCAAYVENTRERAEAIRAGYAALEKQQRELESKCSEFNNLLPSGLSHANPREAIRCRV